MLSCANLVIDEGNTLLGDDEIEKVVTLRMNRDFMELMRKEYPEMVMQLTRQHFRMTLVEEEPGEEPGEERGKSRRARGAGLSLVPSQSIHEWRANGCVAVTCVAIHLQ